MSEPLFIAAEIRLSSAAFKRWLKAAPPPADRYGDWGDAWPSASGEEQPCTTVREALLSAAEAAVTGTDEALMCRHDPSLQTLRFAAMFGDGSTQDARRLAMAMLGMLRLLETYRTCPEEDPVLLGDLGSPPQVLLLGRKASRVTDHEGTWPDWFEDWLTELGRTTQAEKRLAWLDTGLIREFKKRLDLGVLRATRQRPHLYDLHFATDGVHVVPQGEGYWAMVRGEPYLHYALEGADPASFRRVIALDAGHSGFYADRQHIWLKRFFDAHRFATHAGESVQGYCESPDHQGFLRCGNTLWSPVRSHVESRADIDALRQRIAERGGVIVGERCEDDSIGTWVDWMQPTPVDGATLKFLGDHDFEDSAHTYQYEYGRGLVAHKRSP